MAGPLEWSLIDGWLPLVVLALGGLALLALLWTRRGSWWRRRVPVVVAGSALLVVAVKLVVDHWWKPFPDPLPMVPMLWLGVAVAALGLAATRFPALRWRGRTGVTVAAIVVVLAAVVGTNRFFALYPTLRAAIGSGKATDFDKVSGRRPLVTAPAGKYLSEVWKPPAGMPGHGTLSEVRVPPSASGFAARPGFVYLPPAYLATPRARLPVLVLLAGQPGHTRNWIDSGQVVPMMDAYAAAHHGLAPIVLMPDDLGDTMANPMCVDSRLGKVETYLSTDVPAWVAAHLQAGTDRRDRVISGFSQGGTCALQLVVRAPAVYASMIDISGQREPTLGGRSQTVDQVFGGDAAAFARVNPLDIMARRKFPDTNATVVAGSGDAVYLPQQRDVYRACQAAGMHTRWLELSGGHDWGVWRDGLRQSLPWLADKTGMVRP